MNKVFDIKRFWLFLKREIIRAYNDTGLTTLILGLTPAILFGIVQAFSLLISGTTVRFGLCGIISYFAALAIGCIVLPIKIYGPLTDKRFGSEWLMIPASRLEKFSAMMILTCVIVPLALTAITFAVDGIFSLIFNDTYGQVIAANFNFQDLSDYVDQRVSSDFTIDLGFNVGMSIAGATILNWIQYVVFFLLGAIIFDKSKFGKTVLCIIALSVIVSFLSMITIQVFDLEGILDTINLDDPEKVTRIIMTISYSLYAIVILVPTYFIWRRVKTLKH